VDKAHKKLALQNEALRVSVAPKKRVLIQFLATWILRLAKIDSQEISRFNNMEEAATFFLPDIPGCDIHE
jgi:hypothetical protein